MPNDTFSLHHRILIHSAHHETRVALLEHGLLQEIHIERHHASDLTGIVGNVYLGKVVRVLPGMQSAFIDIGLEKMAFLHIADLLEVQQERVAKHQLNTQAVVEHSIQHLPIEQRIFTGQTILVQVLKDPLGTKGARLTTQISLAGRYLVLLPQDNHIGISQKIHDLEVKQALRERLNSALPTGFSWGLIARTQAQDASVAQLTDDIHYLTQVWHTILKQTKTQAAPAMLYRDIGLAQRILRDTCTVQTHNVVVDGIACYTQLKAFAQTYMPAVLPKIQLHTAEHSVFDLAKVDMQISAALNRRVDLNSGAYLVIDQTESMCTIDVNTGSFVGKKQFSDTILHTNLEAAVEIARQLRLRNLGGIILIDFIDMTRTEHRDAVTHALTKALMKDPVYTRIYGFTALGLMELSRKRTRESLAHILLEPCQSCEQTAQVKTPQTIAYEILRELELQTRQFSGTSFTVYTHLKVIAWFNQHPDYLTDLSHSLKRSIHLSPSSVQADHSDSCDKQLPWFEICLSA
jgi:ribonuclease G